VKFHEEQILDYIFNLCDPDTAAAIEKEIHNCPETRETHEGLVRQFAQLDLIQEPQEKQKSQRTLVISAIAAIAIIGLFLRFPQQSAQKTQVTKRVASTSTVAPSLNTHITLLSQTSLTPSEIQPKRFQINFPSPKLPEEISFSTTRESKKANAIIPAPLTLGTPITISEGSQFSLQCNIALTK